MGEDSPENPCENCKEPAPAGKDLCPPCEDEQYARGPSPGPQPPTDVASHPPHGNTTR